MSCKELDEFWYDRHVQVSSVDPSCTAVVYANPLQLRNHFNDFYSQSVFIDCYKLPGPFTQNVAKLD